MMANNYQRKDFTVIKISLSQLRSLVKEELDLKQGTVNKPPRLSMADSKTLATLEPGEPIEWVYTHLRGSEDSDAVYWLPATSRPENFKAEVGETLYSHVSKSLVPIGSDLNNTFVDFDNGVVTWENQRGVFQALTTDTLTKMPGRRNRFNVVMRKAT